MVDNPRELVWAGKACSFHSSYSFLPVPAKYLTHMMQELCTLYICELTWGLSRCVFDEARWWLLETAKTRHQDRPAHKGLLG
jgi:hypothetical protein